MKRVLIVDDHELVRRGIAGVLRGGQAGAEAEVGEAGDSASALARLHAEPWDAVLLDVNMPGRDGLDLLQEIRRLWPRVPVLVLTAYPEEELAVRCIRLGAAGYLTKSSASAELVLALRRVLAGQRYVSGSLAERLAAVLGGGQEGGPHDALSPRELQVVRMVASGRTQREIAAELHLSEKTVSTYRARIAEKLGLSTSVELTRYAMKHRLVD